MAGWGKWHVAAGTAILALAVIITTEPVWTEESSDLESVQQKVEQFAQAGKYAEALAIQGGIATETEKAETIASGRPAEKTVNALVGVSWYALLSHDFQEALGAGNRAHALAPDNLVAETNRAHALLLMGRIREARAIYFAYKNKPMSMTDVDMWQDAITNDVADLQKAGLDYAAVAKISSELGGHSPQSDPDLRDLNQKIQELIQANKFDEALPLAENCVALARKRYGEENVGYAMAISWLGTLYNNQARYAEAEPLFRRALAIDEKMLGSRHTEVAVLLNNLAEVYRTQNRFAEAEQFHKRALSIRENVLGLEHLDVAQSLINLASVYYDQNRYADADHF